MPFPAGRDGARPLQGTGAGRRQGALRVWLPPAKFRNGICGVSHRYRPLRPAGDGTPGSSCPTGGCGEPPRLPGPAAHSEASALRSRGNGWELQQGSSPKGPSTSDNPSVTAFGRASSLCTREPWGRGNPSFLRWTGIRAAVPGAWPPPTKFRPGIWSAVRSPRPTEAMRVLHRSIWTYFVVSTTFRRRDPYAGSCYPGAGGIRYH